MKFKYDIKNNFFKMYAEANYLVAYKMDFLKNNKKNIKNLYTSYFMFLIIVFILFILSIFLGSKLITRFLFILNVFCICYLSIMLVSYKKYKKDNHKGEIIIDENGITDNSDINITFPWEKIELIGVTKNMLAIVMDSPFVIILKPNKKIISEIKKYKDIKVIENK